RRCRLTVALIVLAALLVAGVLAAALLAGDPKEEAAKTVPMTVKETVTLPATTVVQTGTTEAETTPAPETAAPPRNRGLPRGDGRGSDDDGAGDGCSLRQPVAAERPGPRADASRQLRGGVT